LEDTNELVPMDVVVGERNIYKGGFNFGGGITTGASGGAQFFVEARYHRMLTSGRATELLPVSAGIRW
jgi:hypothetical protein